MKGVIFNLLEDFVAEKFGYDFYQIVLEKLGYDQDVFVGPKTYPDSIFLNILTEVISKKSLDINTTVKLFGFYCYPLLAARIPKVMKNLNGPEEILLHLDDIIHVEVKKLLENAETPKFDVKREEDHLVVIYSSRRKLCPFVEGSFEGLANSHNMRVEYTHEVCMHKGHDSCQFKVKFIPL